MRYKKFGKVYVLEKFWSQKRDIPGENFVFEKFPN